MTLRFDASIRSSAGALWLRARSFFDSLAGRLLALTAVAVLAAEIVIFVPALASFHESWMRDRVNLAQTAALALAAAPDDYDVAQALQYELLANAEVKRIAMRRNEVQELILDAGEPMGAMTVFDLTTASDAAQFFWAFDSFFAPPGRVLRVLAEPRFEAGELIEIVFNEAPLKRALYAWAFNFALVSTLILMAAGALVYATLSFAFVRPIRDLTQAIEKFRDRPEDASVSFVRSKRADEIGRAERAAADMAEQIRASLRQRERLAALGAAVARIAHDLRNMLATAQLVTDRLSKSEDPIVRQLAPRLERAISRASGLASSTLRFGRADEAAPHLQKLGAAEAVADAADDALAAQGDAPCRIEIADDLIVLADPEHLHRILVNLMRNAAQAMNGRADQGLIAQAVREGDHVVLDLIDHGPGVPSGLRAKLFEPFVSADRAAGGTGLGLAIARELARSMGGDVSLLRSDENGAAFRVTLQAG